jgi:hypothetical protein
LVQLPVLKAKTAKTDKTRAPRAKKLDTFVEQVVIDEPGRLSFTLPIKTISEANKGGEHWTKRYKRQEDQKTIIYYAIRSHIDKLKLPCTVTFKRYGPKLMDAHDNLPACFKRLVDYIAELLTGKTKGRGDSDPRITWKYDQEKCKSYGISIVFEFA